MDVVRTCVDCKKEFLINSLEADWYNKKGLQLPKRCKSCRKIKRERNKENERTKV